MIESYKEKNFNEKERKLKKNGNRLLTRFLLISFIGYFFFFSSKLWMPAPYEGVEITPFGVGVETNDRTVAIENWIYSKQDKKMQILISIDNLSIDGINSYKWNVKTSSEELDTKTIIEKEDLVVLEVNKVPRRWTEMALTMNVKEVDRNKAKDFTEIKIYTNDKTVQTVSHIRRKTEKAFRKELTTCKISNYREQLSDTLEEKKQLKTEFDNAEKRIKELTKELDYQTETEQAETKDRIQTLQNEKSNIEMKLGETEKQIEDLKEKIVIQNKLLNGM